MIILLLSLVWLGISLWLIHLVVTSVGMTLVNAQILNEGNEQLLNNSDQGILIFDQISEELMFANKAVSKLQ